MAKLKKKTVKKTATKKAAIKKVKKTKPAKKASPKKAAPKTFKAVTEGTPCICIKKRGRWFCMKEMPDGSLERCDGPFATKSECEEHVCLD